MEFGIAGKVALVTGGSRGIGRAVALALAVEGCRVAICARGEEDLRQAERQMKSIGYGLGIQADCTLLEDVKRVVDTAARWGPVEILVNNVGGKGRRFEGDVSEGPTGLRIAAYDANVVPAVRFTQQVLPGMKDVFWGRVVCIASLNGREGGDNPWYTMAKAAEIAYMKSLSLDPLLTRAGITFNSVAPGPVLIPQTGWGRMAQEDPAGFHAYTDQLPMGRLGRPEEVASVVTFLCSEKASLVNGACIAIDGGQGRAL